jgi:hypothetical protein
MAMAAISDKRRNEISRKLKMAYGESWRGGGGVAYENQLGVA